MSETGIRRRTVLKATALGVGAVGLAGTVSADVLGPAAIQPPDEDAHHQVPELDLDTLEADTEYGVLQATRVEDSFVGLVGDGRVIGLASGEAVGAGDVPDESTQVTDDAIVGYLYDRGAFALVVGEVEDAGSATLESVAHSDFDATIELVMEADVVTGSVRFEGEDDTPFTAYGARGVGGVYWAAGIDGADDPPAVSADWVVLPDGRQWGCVCVMPPMMPESPCCMLRQL